MEVSNNELEPGGEELIETVLAATGLPDPWARQELDQILEHSGQRKNDLTLNQLREAMAAYLEAMHLDFLNGNNQVSE